MASDVNITSEVLTYEYVGALPKGVGSTLTIPPVTYIMNMIVPAGGSQRFQNVPVLTPSQKLYLQKNNPLKLPSEYLEYTVRVTFNGYEVKNGSPVSVSATGNVMLTQ